jgi:hypothetical protein
MTNCSFCMKRLGSSEKRYHFSALGVEYCLDCMTCSVCDSKDPRQEGGIIGTQPFCQIHFEMYKDILQRRPITEWPNELVNARLKFLYILIDRDMKILNYLVKGPREMEPIAETIALAGGDFQTASFLKLSDMKRKSRITTAHEQIKTDVQECVRQASEIEALKQNSEVIPEIANSTDIRVQHLQVKQKEFSEQMIERAIRRRISPLEPNNNKSIDAKEFLSGKIIDLPEPYLIVRDSPYQKIMGITFNNLAAVINILARKYNYKIISTACDNHTMYVFMEKIGSLR